MDQKGQISVDLLFATLILIIVVTSIVSISSSGIDVANGTEISKAKVLADDVSRSIDTVFSNGYGQYSVLQLPNVSNDTTTDFKYTYVIKVDSSGVTVTYMDKSIVSSIIPNNKLGNVPVPMSPGKKYNITNDQGIINIKELS